MFQKPVALKIEILRYSNFKLKVTIPGKYQMEFGWYDWIEHLRGNL